ncbi:MAG: lipoyl(octanoyl) transferase LipB [Candidatus Kapabacteria bacterium]|nr:lipoyl(octanoyl) transferase LipB [Candidatus Kapabacteria bacterium]
MFEFQDWGLISYSEALDRQKDLYNDALKSKNKNFLVFCEHPSVITIGRNGNDSNIIASQDFLKNFGIDIFEINRGGDVTLHNPGQLVGYPIFNLSLFKEDLHWFLRELEACIIDLISGYGIIGERVDGLTGVWVESNRKICAMGLHCSRWITSHGFALNVNNNLNEFEYIVPCGISDKKVTSISKETGTDIDMINLKHNLKMFFEKSF